MSSLNSGEPQIWAGLATLSLPAAIRAAASLRCTLRLVGSLVPYSALRLRKPLSPQGRPTLPATEKAVPSPAWYWPERTSMLPPLVASLSRKFITPAMASEPYCAEAPSRSTSTWRRAIDGIAEMSGPWAPSATPLPSQ